MWPTSEETGAYQFVLCRSVSFDDRFFPSAHMGCGTPKLFYFSSSKQKVEKRFRCGTDAGNFSQRWNFVWKLDLLCSLSCVTECLKFYWNYVICLYDEKYFHFCSRQTFCSPADNAVSATETERAKVEQQQSHQFKVHECTRQQW